MRRSLSPFFATSLTTLVLAMATTTNAHAQAPDDWAVGSWAGELDAGPQKLQIIFHLRRGDDGSLTGTMDVPAQGATGIPLTTVTADATTLKMTFPVPGGGTYEGMVAATGSIAGTFSQGPASFPMELARSTGGAAPARPQEPKPPYPYDVEDVTFTNPGAGIALAGTLTAPRGDGPFPGVILVTGSGPQNRDEALAGHRPFLVLADHLTRAGIVVLRYDDRGVGESQGDFAAATTEDLTSDALSALTFLASRPEVSADRVGIAGHSEGGLIAPLAASRSTAVRFVVMMAGPGIPGIDILVEQGRLIGRAAGTPQEALDVNAGIQRGLAHIAAAEPDRTLAASRMRAFMKSEIEKLPAEVLESAEAADQLSDRAIDQAVAQMNSPWFRYFLNYDPRPVLEQVHVPVLAIVGSNDLQVPPTQSMPEIEAALGRAGNVDATLTVLPGLNHLFQTAGTGAPSEYAQIEETMSPVALETISAWITQRFGARSH